MEIRHVIVGSPQRRQAAQQLQAHLEEETGHIAPIIYDYKGLGCNENHWCAWRYAHMQWRNTNVDTICVIEDDALLADNYGNNLQQALHNAPSPIVSGYLGTSRPPHWQTRIQKAIQEAHTNNATYITAWEMLHGVAIYLPHKQIPSMLEVAPQACYTTAIPKPYDYAIGEWARRTRQPVAYTMPSLVDHDTGPTITHTYRDGYEDTPRHAWLLAQADTQWTTHTTHMM